MLQIIEIGVEVGSLTEEEVLSAKQQKTSSFNLRFSDL